MDDARVGSQRVVVITGAGRGIGRELAEAFAADGWAVAAVAAHQDGLRETARRIESMGGRCLTVALDVADEAAAGPAVERIVDELGGIDALINNAGLQLGKWNTALALSTDDWRRLLDVNVLGALIWSRACRPARAASAGAIVNQSSIAAYGGGFGAYGVSKLALNGLTMALAHELAGDGIRVNGIAPGVMVTEEVKANGDPAFLEAVIDQQLVPRLGAPTDLVGLTRLLCSPDAGFITGQTFTVDGGLGPRP